MATTSSELQDNQLRHRDRVTEELINKTGNDVVDDTTTTTTTKNNNKTTTTTHSQTKRAAMARRGLRSLAIAVVIPISLTFISTLIHLGHHKPDRTLLLLAPWVMHTFFAISSLLMGLSAWLVWADGGFHRKPIALAFYMTHLALTLAWDPVVLGLIGLVVSLTMLVALTGCAATFRQVKPLAGDLALVGVLWGGVIVGLNLMHVYRRSNLLV